MPLKPLTAGLIARFAAIVGEANALTRTEDKAAYLSEWRDRYTGRSPVVLRPRTTEEVCRILALANAECVGVVPQGGNTGLVGGQIPSPDNDEIVLSLGRMNAIRHVDRDGGTLTAEAGVTLAAVQTAARDLGRLFPLSLASEGSAEVGGILATNAGGTAVIAHGSARRLALGLEVVLADGRVWNGLRHLEKDNTGYDLRDLIIGSEGTLGVVTAAVLKLSPLPAESETAVVALQSAAAALQVFTAAQSAFGPALTAFELWCRRAQEFAIAYVPGNRDPLEIAHPWYALIELSHAAPRTHVLSEFLTREIEAGRIRDAAVAASGRQAEQLWRLRESFSEAQKGAGGSIKHDISVPIARIPEFLERADALVGNISPGARPVPFGHFGDGNLHYNISQPEGADRQAYLALWEAMAAAVHDLVHEMGGSISAEHGIGQMKRAALVRYKSEVELDMMRSIKRALDPKGILNPGKLLP